MILCSIFLVIRIFLVVFFWPFDAADVNCQERSSEAFPLWRTVLQDQLRCLGGKKDLNLGERCRYDIDMTASPCHHFQPLLSPSQPFSFQGGSWENPQFRIWWRFESAFEAFGAIPPGHAGKPERNLTLDLSGRCLTECQTATRSTGLRMKLVKVHAACVSSVHVGSDKKLKSWLFGFYYREAYIKTHFS